MTTARAASPRTARAINDRAALDLLARHGPLTATRLRELTGLSRPTVADLVSRLQREGLVTVVGESEENRRGPRARLYGLVADRAHVAAADIRTDSVAFTVADLAGQPAGEALLPVGPGEGDSTRIVTLAVKTLERLLTEAGTGTLHNAVMGAPGLIDPATGALRATGSLPGWHTELLTALRARLGAPVVLENEVNLAAIAEHRLGAARGRDTFVLLWLGHGVGAAVHLDGRLRRGTSGGAGEIGFLPVPGTGSLPTAGVCGGGFHALAGSAAICALARETGLPAPAGDDAAAAAQVVGDAVAGGPPAGRPAAFLAELAERIAVAVAAVAAVLDPGCVVLGGETGRAGGPVLAQAVGRRLADISPLRTEVPAATVPGSPVLSGALLTALDAAREELFTTGPDTAAPGGPAPVGAAGPP